MKASEKSKCFKIAITILVYTECTERCMSSYGNECHYTCKGTCVTGRDGFYK